MKALRDNLKEVTLDKHHNVAFLEYALWKFVAFDFNKFGFELNFEFKLKI